MNAVQTKLVKKFNQAKKYAYLLTLGRRIELKHVPADRFDQHQFALFPLVRVARLLETLRRQVVDGALLPALDHDLGQFGFGRPTAGQLDLVRVLLVEQGLESKVEIR